MEVPRHAAVAYLRLVRRMSTPRQDRSHIVADGRWRILEGSGRDEAARMRARFTRRATPLLERASLLGRIIIRFRINRFVRRHLDRLAPPEALYASRRLALHLRQPILSELHVSPHATPNQTMERTEWRNRGR